MTIHRLPDWMKRLNALVISRMAAPFEWGRNDCGAFAADAVQAMTGFDVLSELRGSRRSERAALRQLRTAGSVSAVLDRAGLQRVDVAFVQRGDVVLLPSTGTAWPVVAVCVGGEAVAPGPGGLEARNAADAIEAWRL